MSIASGISHLIQAGSLHGTRTAAPRSLLPTLQQQYPETQWQYSPWARHGKVWTSNSAISALEMVVLSGLLCFLAPAAFSNAE